MVVIQVTAQPEINGKNLTSRSLCGGMGETPHARLYEYLAQDFANSFPADALQAADAVELHPPRIPGYALAAFL